jgi:hypothetical protein
MHSIANRISICPSKRGPIFGVENVDMVTKSRLSVLQDENCHRKTEQSMIYNTRLNTTKSSQQYHLEFKEPGTLAQHQQNPLLYFPQPVLLTHCTHHANRPLCNHHVPLVPCTNRETFIATTYTLGGIFFIQSSINAETQPSDITSVTKMVPSSTISRLDGSNKGMLGRCHDWTFQYTPGLAKGTSGIAIVHDRMMKRVWHLNIVGKEPGSNRTLTFEAWPLQSLLKQVLA